MSQYLNTWHRVLKPNFLEKAFFPHQLLNLKSIQPDMGVGIVHVDFHQLGPLVRVGLLVAMSVCPSVHSSIRLNFFGAFHLPSDYMISFRPLIGHPPPLTLPAPPQKKIYR